MTEPAELPLDTLVGAIDIISRLKGIERNLLILSDAIANLQILVTAMEIARTTPVPAPMAPNPYLPGIYTFPSINYC